ncbi:MAG TPA: hypothetical protein VGP85_25415 [Pyrinomonadaceae bacterium]|jgi:DUF4097 and DUF4098 domain-containing protein YvlB|nr:hypothetical protein [Pyrinomonadaceae bacterium]
MLKKALITAVLIVIALASNGARPAAALSLVTQDLRPVPLEPRSVDRSGVPVDSGEEFREEFHQTYPLSTSGRVGLENINGGVQIKVWDRAAVQVDAIKKAWRKERLAEARIEVNSTEDNLHIKTEYPDWNQTFHGGNDRYDNPATVEYILTVPRKAALESIELINGAIDIEGAEGSVKASSINGPVNARGLLGDVRLSTINGPLKAIFIQLDEARPISLGSVNGPVVLIIPSDANASVRAGTVHGGISNDFGLKVKHGEYVGHNLNGQLGNGGPRIKLENVNGPIDINHAQDGKTLSPATSVGASDSDEEDEKGEVDADVARQVNQAVATAVNVNTKIALQAQREAQRQVEVALRDAQKEIEQAQREVQRDNQRQVREQMRTANVARIRINNDDDRATAQESKTFTVNASPSVNVSTFDGAVRVHGWDKSEVMYTVTKKAEDDEGLREISTEATQNAGQISVITRSDNNDRNGTATIEVWVPRKSTLHVSSDDGSLKLDGVSGEITLRTGDGSIEVNDAGGQLKVNTGDGHIHVIKFDGQLDAVTGDGSIQMDGNFNALAARTGDGAISLTVPSGSDFTVETNADGDVTNEGLTLTEDIAPSKRVKRWRVGNGGKVFVLKTGDGQIVLRSR